MFVFLTVKKGIDVSSTVLTLSQLLLPLPLLEHVQAMSKYLINRPTQTALLGSFHALPTARLISGSMDEA